jgi:uncharacterized Rossmann fold enzyme
MGRRNSTNLAQPVDGDRAVSVAEAMRRDFIELIAIFDRELASAPATGAAIAEARSAAERGLRLSGELLELLRAPE